MALSVGTRLRPYEILAPLGSGGMGEVFNDIRAHISPDSHWIAYVSDESGKPEVYVQPFPDLKGGKWQISKGGGDDPQWRSDGKELFYMALDAKLMAVEVKTGSSFEYSIPKQLFHAPVQRFKIIGYRNNYAASADGQRFLISKVVERQSNIPITVVLNWQALLIR